jgi:hypothetical protein
MNVRTLSIAGVAAVVIAVAAALSSRSSNSAGPTPDSTSSKNELFPGLSGKVNDIATLTVQSKGSTFTIEKKGDAFVLADKGGYPVTFDKVKELVNQIAFFRIVDKKTQNPELFKKLEVEDVDAPEAASSKVTLKDASGSVLADVLIGKTAPGGGPTLSSLYVRKPGDNQAYEVSGRVYVDGTALNWLDKQVLKIERTRIHRATITHPDGSKLELFKNDPDDKNFTVAELAEGAELKWPGVADATAGALEYMNFEDVQAAGSDIDFNDANATTARFQTFDGLIVTARIVEKDAKHYAKFEAAADPAARVEVKKIIPPPPPKEGEPPADPAPAPTEEKKVPGKTVEEVEKEAKELSDKLAPWTYVLPGYSAANFTKKMSDMLKEATPPEMLARPPEEGGGALVPPGDGPVIPIPTEPDPDAPAPPGDPAPLPPNPTPVQPPANPPADSGAPATNPPATPPVPPAKPPAADGGR